MAVYTIKDRAVQGIYKTALEPKFEAKFEANSYGFRPGHNAQDAIGLIFNNLRLSEKWVLDADIKGCFDNINHDFLLKLMGGINPSDKKIVRQWLKTGVMEKQNFSPLGSGTPQGGIISPLLANIALDGMREYLFRELRKEYKSNTRGKMINGSTLGVIRYADDFVIIHKDKDVIERAKELLETWLQERGLELSQEKTKIVHSTEGFDFLIFNGKHFDALDDHWHNDKRKAHNKHKKKFIIKPSKDSIKQHYENISDQIDTMKAWKQEEVIKKLNPMITGWANYFRNGVAKKTFTKLDRLLWLKLRKWAIRRKGRKSPAQALQLYFHRIGTRKWCFSTFKDGKPDMVLRKYSDVKIERHVMVKTGKSYYDGDTVYWASRLSKGYGNIAPSKAKLLKKEKGKCAYCGSQFIAEDLIESHHIKFKARGGKDPYKNLVIMHRHCHDQLNEDEATRLSKSGKFVGESEDSDRGRDKSFYEKKKASIISHPLLEKKNRKRIIMTSNGLIAE